MNHSIIRSGFLSSSGSEQMLRISSNASHLNKCFAFVGITSIPLQRRYGGVSFFQHLESRKIVVFPSFGVPAIRVPGPSLTLVPSASPALLTYPQL